MMYIHKHLYKIYTIVTYRSNFVKDMAIFGCHSIRRNFQWNDDPSKTRKLLRNFSINRK